MTTDRATLLDALERATGRVPPWTDIVLLRNVGPVPPLTDGPGDTIDARGFHLHVLGRGGRVTHYVKCRAAEDPRGLREATVLERVAGTEAASCLPRAAVTHGARLQVIILEAVAGVRMDVRLHRHSAQRAPGDVAAVLEAMERIRAAVRNSGAPATFEAGAALASSLETLAQAGVEAAAISRLRAAAGGTWAWQPQHGDLWPPNVIWTGEGPILLDFEAFGEIGHPMFDAWHMLRSARHAKGERATWLDVLSPRTPTDRHWRDLLEHWQARSGARGTDLRSGLAWYIVRAAATLVQRGLPERFLWAYVGDVRRVAGLLA